MLFVLRLTKSGIEYVILAGRLQTSLCSLSEAESRFWRVIGRSTARAARDFLKDFDVLAPQNPTIFLYLTGHQHTGAGMLRCSSKIFGAGILMSGYLNARV